MGSCQLVQIREEHLRIPVLTNCARFSRKHNRSWQPSMPAAKEMDPIHLLPKQAQPVPKQVAQHCNGIPPLSWPPTKWKNRKAGARMIRMQPQVHSVTSIHSEMLDPRIKLAWSIEMPDLPTFNRYCSRTNHESSTRLEMQGTMRLLTVCKYHRFQKFKSTNWIQNLIFYLTYSNRLCNRTQQVDSEG